MSHISLAIFRTGKPYYYHRFTGEKYDEISSQINYTTHEGVEYFDTIENIECQHNIFTVTIKFQIGEKQQLHTIMLEYIYERGIFGICRFDPARILQAIHAHVQFWPQLSKLISYRFMDVTTIRKGIINNIPTYFEMRYGTICNPDAVRDCISEPIQELESVKSVMYIDRKDNGFRVQLFDQANRQITVLVCYNPETKMFTDLMYDPTEIIPVIIKNSRFFVYFNSFVPQELRVNRFIYNEDELDRFAEFVQIIRNNIVQESYVYDMRTGEKLKYQIDKPAKFYEYIDEIIEVNQLNKNAYTVALRSLYYTITTMVEYVGDKFLVNKFDPHKIIKAIKNYQENPQSALHLHNRYSIVPSDHIDNQSRIAQWKHTLGATSETLGVLRAGKAPNGQVMIYDSRNGEIEGKVYHNILPRPFLHFNNVISIIRDGDAFVVTVKVDDRTDFITVKYDKSLHCFDVPKYEPMGIICAILFEESCMPYFIETGHPSFKDYVASPLQVNSSIPNSQTSLLGRFKHIPRLSLEDIKSHDEQVENEKSDTDALFHSSPESNDTINIGYEVDVTNDANDQMTNLNDQNNQDHYLTEMIRMRNQEVREPSEGSSIVQTEIGTVISHHNSEDSEQLTSEEYKVLYAYRNFWIGKFGVCDKSIKQRIPETEKPILDLILDNIPDRIDEPIEEIRPNIEEIRPDIQKILDKFNCKSIRGIMMDEARELLNDEEYKIYQEALQKELEIKKIADQIQVSLQQTEDSKQKLQRPVHNRIRDDVSNSEIRNLGEFGYMAKNNVVRSSINIHMQSILNNVDKLEDIVGQHKPIKDIPREDNLEVPETKFDVALVLPDTIENNKTTETIVEKPVIYHSNYPRMQHDLFDPPPRYIPDNYASRAYQAQSRRADENNNTDEYNDADEDIDRMINEEFKKIDIIYNNRAEMVNIINSDSATGIIVSLAYLCNSLTCSMDELIDLFELNSYIENANTIQYENIPHIRQKVANILEKIDMICEARRHKLFYNAKIAEQKGRARFLIDVHGDKQFEILLRTFITMIDADYNKFLACYGIFELNSNTIKRMKYQLKKQLRQQLDDQNIMSNFWGA